MIQFALATRHRTSYFTAFALVFCCLSASSLSAADGPQVQLNASKASPRSIEPLTENAVVRDYRGAWTSLSNALEQNSVAPLNAAFTAEAKTVLWQSVLSQQRTGLARRYSNQTHRLDAVFYAPEGDVIELHDTAEYQLQFLDQGKIVHEEHVVAHYVVLMTPSADRWLVRYLQAVPQF